MINIRKLESELWESADLLRAGSKLTSNQYCMPVLGLIFLRYAYSRFKMVEAEILKNRPSRGGRVMPVEASDFAAKSALYLPKESKSRILRECRKTSLRHARNQQEQRSRKRKLSVDLLFLFLSERAQQSRFRYGVLCNRQSGKGYCDTHAHGVAQRGIRMTDLKAYPFILPSVNIIEDFARIAKPIINNVQALQKMNSGLSEARDRLLPKLISGEIEV